MNASAATAPPRGLHRITMLRPLAVRDFRLLWLGETVSVMGDQFYGVALPWLVLQLTGSAIALGTVLIVSQIPRAVLILFGGAIADRSSPRLLMLGSNVIRGVIVGLLAVLILTGRAELWQLYVLSIIFGAVSAIFYPAFDSIAPRLVDEEQLSASNALLQSSAQLAGFAGPVLAGIIIVAAGTIKGSGYAMAFDAFSFAISALSLLLMRSGGRPVRAANRHADESPATSTSMLGEIKAGILYVIRAPLLRSFVLITMAANFAISGPFEVGIPTLARDRFGSAAAFGAIIAAFGIGALIGAVISGSFPMTRRRGLLFLAVTPFFTIGPVIMGLAPNPSIAVAVAFIMGVANGFIGVVVITWMQSITEPSMLGRVMSLFALAGFGLTPLSLAFSGVIAQFNVTLLFLLAGALMACVTLTLFLTPTVRSFD